VSPNSPPSTPEPTLEARLRQLCPAAQAGDAQALAELRRLLDAHPDFWRDYADLARHVEDAWLALLDQGSLLRREALQRRLAALKGELAAPSPSPLERLLVERIAACWLQVCYADLLSYPNMRQCTSLALFTAAERRQDRSQRRYLAAIKQLALVRKLLVRPPAPIEVATRLMGEGPVPRASRGSQGRTLGIGIDN
jgi:hypothetical protein